MGLRTGLVTQGAQYTFALAHCAEDVSRLVKGWNVTDVVGRDVGIWLSEKLGWDVDIPSLVETLDLLADGAGVVEKKDDLSRAISVSRNSMKYGLKLTQCVQ